MSNPKKRWTDPVTTRRVPSKWKGEQGGTRGARGNKGNKGSKGSEGIFMYITYPILCV